MATGLTSAQDIEPHALGQHRLKPMHSKSLRHLGKQIFTVSLIGHDPVPFTAIKLKNVRNSNFYDFKLI